MPSAIEVELHGRTYRAPRRPTVVICADGCDPDYIRHAIANGVTPTLARFMDDGFAAVADAAMPTFTNPNNMSIVTGAPPAVHGISGNYYLDRDTGREVMVTDASLLRSPTIPGLLSRAGVATAVVTAKDKLRRALGHGLEGICFSSERADDATVAENGIADLAGLVGRPAPDPYSADLSLYVMDAGIRLLETGRARLLYLSLSDYVQHKHAPGEPEADRFYAALDARLARLAALGAVVALTADHGMSDKAAPDGTPNVLYLEDAVNERFGADAVRVICPITDPFVRHHGALGAFVRAYLRRPDTLGAVLRFVAGLPGVEAVMDRAEACARFELPADREGDFVAVAGKDWVIGARRAEHDLSALAGKRLRSHGGLGEQPVPFILSHPLSPAHRERAAERLRNRDIFDFALNGVV
ncbi:phosphonoacetate hydrolase [Azospirillum halopraeferens]|uniref:phosphonoacetate hydrolase n=1 Tax=Azospirillum halopraeferens TaxID=34010 RepID=UPI0004043173|nr:phosphonoacetate hydrolase [Azospirillum halopraeferens]